MGRWGGDGFLDGKIIIGVIVVKVVRCVWLIIDRSR